MLVNKRLNKICTVVQVEYPSHESIDKKINVQSCKLQRVFLDSFEVVVYFGNWGQGILVIIYICGIRWRMIYKLKQLQSQQ